MNKKIITSLFTAGIVISSITNVSVAGYYEHYWVECFDIPGGGWSTETDNWQEVRRLSDLCAQQGGTIEINY